MLDLLRSRFETKYIPEPNSGCWLWIGAYNGRGYGAIGIPRTRTMITAHRLSFLLFNGPIPDGMEIRHTCDMCICVNPNHLIPGTHQQNMDDCRIRGRRAKGFKNPRTKLSLEQVAAIIADSRSHQKIADEYQIHNSYVSRLKSRKQVRVC